MSRTRCYSELVQCQSFEERFDYLMLDGRVGVATFGFDRYMNQTFYRSREWRDIRRAVLIRDEGCDLGVFGYEIPQNPLIHHMNPITAEDISDRVEWILDPEFLITTSYATHNAIHYGDKSTLPTPFAERQPNDTKLW